MMGSMKTNITRGFFTKRKSPPQSPNIYLIGIMGSGKSTVGRLLAERLNFFFIDMDRELEMHTGLPLIGIHSSLGTRKIQQLHMNFLKNGHPPSNCIVACSGGLAARSEHIARIRNKGMVFFLTASPNTLLARIRNHPKRPILAQPDALERVRKLSNHSHSLGIRATKIIDTENLSSREVAESILTIYRQTEK